MKNKKEELKEIATLVSGFLMAVMGFLATLNIKFEWLTEASISAFGTVIVAAGILVVTLYAVYKNTFVLTKRAKEQKETLKQKGLK